MNFEEFKEMYFEKNNFLPSINPNGMSKEDLVNEILRASIEETLNILEEYTIWFNEQIKKEDN